MENIEDLDRTWNRWAGEDNGEAMLDACVEDKLRAFLPSRSMCTDNAAMVAAVGWWRLHSDGASPLDTGADPNLKIPVLG